MSAAAADRGGLSDAPPGLCLLSGFLVLAASGAAAQTGARPNIILIVADDPGTAISDPTGRRSSDAEPRPAGAEGLRFTQFYAGSTVVRAVAQRAHDGPAHGPHPACAATPARATTPRRRSVQETSTVADVLKQAGYSTALIGKWGLGEMGSEGAPDRQGSTTSTASSTRRTRTTTTPTSSGATRKESRCATS